MHGACYDSLACTCQSGLENCMCAENEIVLSYDATIVPLVHQIAFLYPAVHHRTPTYRQLSVQFSNLYRGVWHPRYRNAIRYGIETNDSKRFKEESQWDDLEMENINEFPTHWGVFQVLNGKYQCYTILKDITLSNGSEGK